jgi:two-component system, NarL family, response regulator LiaR
VKHILIVDDSAVVRRSLRTLLEKGPDWDVCGEAENGCEGVDRAQKLHPDLIVMDLVMPVLNGIEASRLLKRLMPATPIVMFTSFTDPYIKATALAAGLDALIDKAEGATALLNSIQGLLVSEIATPADSAA